MSHPLLKDIDFALARFDDEFLVRSALKKARDYVDRTNADWLKFRLALNQIAHPESFGTLHGDPKVIAAAALLL